MNEQKIRCFLALPLNDEGCDQVQSWVNSLQMQRWSGRVRWVEPRNWHITLAFLGDQTADKVDNLRHPLQQACLLSAMENAHAIELKSSRIGGFPDEKSGIIALEFHSEEVLESLKENLDAVLSAQGVEQDSKKFRPHLTLGRVSHDQKREVESLLCEITIQVSQIGLYQSTLTPRGSEYQALWALPFVQR